VLWQLPCTDIIARTNIALYLEGSIGALLGDTVVIGNPGDLIFKPREQWHTFWNAGDAPARILEIISPAGFENYFRELGAELRGPPQRAR
jgi:quercetin dioxygenase-like cupin family protein